MGMTESWMRIRSRLAGDVGDRNIFA